MSTSIIASNPRMPRVGSLVLGRFEILDALGEGGFGVVYLANDQDAGGKVALKVLDPEKSNQEDFVERFRQEVKIIRSLGHHNTVKVFDVGQTEKGCHFMVGGRKSAIPVTGFGVSTASCCGQYHQSQQAQ